MQKIMKLWLPGECKLQRLSLPRKNGKTALQACFLCGAPDHELPSCLEARWEKTRFQVHHDEIAQIPKTLVMVFLEDEIASFFGCCMLQMKGASSQKKVTVLEDRRTGFF